MTNQALLMKKRRSEWLAQNGPCKKCGACIDLEVHHVKPEDKVTNSVWSWREERRLQELSKCIVLCNSCHKEETFKQLSVGHGHIATYKRGCRCEECRYIKSIENAKRCR